MPDLIRNLLGWGVTALCCTSVAAADACDKVEFAELQAKAKRQLEDDYCHYKELVKIRYDLASSQRETQRKFLNLGALDRAEAMSRDAKSTADSAYRCDIEAGRALDVYRKRFGAKAEPKCKG